MGNHEDGLPRVLVMQQTECLADALGELAETLSTVQFVIWKAVDINLPNARVYLRGFVQTQPLQNPKMSLL